MKFILAATAAIVLALPGAAAANGGHTPQDPCAHNPTTLCDNVVITVDQPTAAECPAGGFVLVVNQVRYKVCNGLPGAPGADGQPGADGAPGTPGPAGATGTNGAAGVAGVPGVSGTDGAVGAPGSTTVIAAPKAAKRAAKCERRLNRKGKLVIVCKPMTCPRRASKANPRRLVVKCPARKHAKA